MPTLGTVHLVYCGMKTRELIPEPRRNCGKYFRRMLSLIGCPMAKNKRACATLVNTSFKGFVFSNNDQERELGCLHRREKLGVNH